MAKQVDKQTYPEISKAIRRHAASGHPMIAAVLKRRVTGVPVPATQTVNEDLSMKRGDHMRAVARQKLNAGPDWEICSIERVGDTNDFYIKGGVPRIVAQGKNKGQKRWAEPLQAVVVTPAEIKAMHAVYEADTGRCGDCFGIGSVHAGWSCSEGFRLKKCCRCDGYGNAPPIESRAE